MHPELYYFVESFWSEWKSHIRCACEKLIALLKFFRAVKLIVELSEWVASLLPLFRVRQFLGSPRLERLSIENSRTYLIRLGMIQCMWQRKRSS